MQQAAVARLLVLWVRIPPGAWMPVPFECCVLSGRVLCDAWSLAQRSPNECGLSLCDREAPIMRSRWPTGGGWGLLRQDKKIFIRPLPIIHEVYRSVLTARNKNRLFLRLNFQIQICINIFNWNVWRWTCCCGSYFSNIRICEVSHRISYWRVAPR